MPRSDYNNNPGNLRPPKGMTFDGQIGIDDKGFAIFETPEQGQNALVNDVKTKIGHGLNTPEDFINKYSPAGDNSEEARNNYKIHLADQLGLKSTTDPFPKDAHDKIAQAISSFEGGTWSTPEQSSQAPAQPAVESASAPASAASGSNNTNNENVNLSLPLPAQSAITGTAGAVVGAGLGLTPKVQIPYQIYKDWKNKQANNVENVAKSPAIIDQTNVEYPSEPWVAKPQNAQDQTIQNGQSRTERVTRGGLNEEGINGQERILGSNETTAQRAARQAEANETALAAGLKPKQVFANFPDVAPVSNGRVLGTVELANQLEQERKNKEEIARANYETLKKAEQRVLEQRIKKLTAGFPSVEEMNAQQKMELTRLQLEKEAAQRTFGARMSFLANQGVNALKNTWEEGLPFGFRSLPARMASTVGGAAAAIPEAIVDFQNGKKSEAAQDVGIGAGLGSLLSRIPAKVMTPISTGLQAIDAVARARANDLAGAATSAVGAAAPYVAPLALGTELGGPVGLGIAATAPLANAAIEWNKKHSEEPMKAFTHRGFGLD